MPNMPIMPNTNTPSEATIAARAAALRAYNEAVDSDGTSASTWDVVARDLAVVAEQLSGDPREYVRARHVDAVARGNYARRMVAHARTLRTIDAPSQFAAIARA